MSRRRRAVPRQITPDPRFNSTLIAKLINALMRDGKKSVAQGILYKALERVSSRENDTPPVTLLETAVDHIRPSLEIKSRRVGGATYQVPIEVRGSRKETLALRWIVRSARSRSGKSMIENLAAEIQDAYHDRGTAVRRREETHRMAEANRAFAHYRW